MAKVVSPTRVKVKVPVSSPTSEAAASVASMVTTGTGLSAMVTVAVVVAPRSYFAPSASVRMTVSGPSTRASLSGVMVRVTEADPAGMTMLVPMLA